jgi:hypothetical protein
VKLNLSYFLVSGVVVTLGLFASTTSAQAQEEGIPGYELQDPLHPGIGTEEKTLLLDPESKSFKRDSTSIASKPVSAKKYTDSGKPSSGKPKNEEEDPLSFNFLYYIIQKFKVSDLIEQQ